MEFKDLLRTRRKELGITLEEIGDIVGVSKATVQRWESGAIQNIRRDKIESLATALKTTPAYLMGWKNASSEQDNLVTCPKLFKLSEEEETLIDNYRHLNHAGQQKLIDYSDDLVSSKKYVKNTAVKRHA